MREILFRGKRTDNGEWVSGHNIILTKRRAFIVPTGEYIDDCRTKTGRLILIIPQIEIIPETIGQFTGLTDKNGKKIFEGDILDCGDRVVIVKWHSYCGTWDSMFIKYAGEQYSNGITPAEWKYRAVIIGNIHGNPELLKGGE